VQLTQIQAALANNLYQVSKQLQQRGWVPRAIIVLLVEHHFRPGIEIFRVLNSIAQAAPGLGLRKLENGDWQITRPPTDSEVNKSTEEGDPLSDLELRKLITKVTGQTFPVEGFGQGQLSRTSRIGKTHAESTDEKLAILTGLMRLEQENGGWFRRQETTNVIAEINPDLATDYTLTYMKNRGWIENCGRGLWRLTKTGRERVKKKNVFKRKPAS
jgi:hypothetical protein